MIYTQGTVDVTNGSINITGNSTEFLKYCSPGDIFSIEGESVFYIVASVPSNTALTLTTPYLFTSQTNLAYSINSSKTPNLGLLLLNSNDPDIVSTLNQTIKRLDETAGSFLTYYPLKSVSYSGENAFYIDGYYPTELEEGRVIQLSYSGEIVNIDTVDKNWRFHAEIASSFGETGFNVSLFSGEQSLKENDIVVNVRTAEKVFTKSYSDTLFIFSGEKPSWEIGDEIYSYGHTRQRAFIVSFEDSICVISPFEGDTLSTDHFNENFTLYNYDKGTNLDVLTATLSGENIHCLLNTQLYTGNWEQDDVVYTVLSDIKTTSQNLNSSIETVSYGAKSNVSHIGANQISFGKGLNEVNASKIPCVVTGLTSVNVESALAELVSLLDEHTTEGENAHLSSSIPFTNNTSLGPNLISATQNEAINELKTRFNSGIMLDGVVDLTDTEYSFYSNSFMNYPGTFFSGEWYCVFNTGVNEGEIKRLNTFVEGTFNFVSGEAFTYVPEEGDTFKVINRSSTSGESTGVKYLEQEVTLESNTIDFSVFDLILVQGDSPGVGVELLPLTDVKECMLVGASDTNYVVVEKTNIITQNPNEFYLKSEDFLKLIWCPVLNKYIELSSVISNTGE